MPIVTVQELIDAGVHYGHRTSRWNPKMKPFLQGKRNSIHIIDLKSTVRGLVRGSHFLRNVSRDGWQVLFVGTKRGAKTVIREEAQRSGIISKNVQSGSTKAAWKAFLMRKSRAFVPLDFRSVSTAINRLSGIASTQNRSR